MNNESNLNGWQMVGEVNKIGDPYKSKNGKVAQWIILAVQSTIKREGETETRESKFKIHTYGELFSEKLQHELAEGSKVYADGYHNSKVVEEGGAFADFRIQLIAREIVPFIV